jgi:Tfp pilus assembly protein PilF
MEQASEQSVLGDFNDSKFSYAGITSVFYKRDGKFYVRTDGRDGRLADFEIRYTFGVYPLQQYLVEFQDGRLQALSIAWDARPRERGGQRWFHLYPDERITHDDELHWSRPAQNWNNMCADCHSTAVRKNYDASADRFQTASSEIGVGCEACHGPASDHLTWAADQRGGRLARIDTTLGLRARLDERHGVAWSVSGATGNAARSQPRTTEREIEVCAQCHSRRGQIADGYEAGRPFLDFYHPALLTRPVYHADGQQRAEVYSWGLFLQSKMYANGVTCSDCHNPHSGKLRAEGNAVCATCHLPAKYDAPAHHQHEQGSASAACTACHMPTTTYMVVDPRHDHSLRVPRPDLSVTLGTPNACTGCHVERDARWAASRVSVWYGHERRSHQQFAASFAAADVGAFDAQARLRALANDGTQPSIARATALAELDASGNSETLGVLAVNLRDPNALVRFGALQSVARLRPELRMQLAAPLLSDAVRAVRIEAARLLAGVPGGHWSTEHLAAFQRAAGEFIETQHYNADRADARVSLGTFLALQGDPVSGEAELNAAIRIDPLFQPAYVNLADLYRVLGRDADGERVLRAGLELAPRSGLLHHALGLALVRLQRLADAVTEFESATALEPANARFAYVYAVALHSTGKAEAAIARLEKALTAHPANSDILSALVSFHRTRGESAQAEHYAEQLRLLSGGR